MWLHTSETAEVCSDAFKKSLRTWKTIFTRLKSATSPCSTRASLVDCGWIVLNYRSCRIYIFNFPGGHAVAHPATSFVTLFWGAVYCLCTSPHCPHAHPHQAGSALLPEGFAIYHSVGCVYLGNWCLLFQADVQRLPMRMSAWSGFR